MSRVQKLLVVSHVVHYSYQGQTYAYGPYTREIDIWADLFPEVLIASPCRSAAPPADCLAFTRPNISMIPQLELGGDNYVAKLIQILRLPEIVFGLVRAMCRVDAIHVRCPGNLGLLGCLLAPLFSRRRVAKYAGQWNGYPGERPTLRLQRYLLRSKWWGAPVTVYGQWPNQPPHIQAFFTSMMTGPQVRHAVGHAEHKSTGQPLRILFSGRLAPEKHVEALIEALALAATEGLQFEAAIVGDGIERASLEAMVSKLGLSGRVTFVGALPFDESLKWNEWAHCLVLPSRHSEGWPKVIAEAMCYGVLCVAVDHGQLSSMLDGRGILLQAGNPREIADALVKIGEHPEKYAALSQAAAKWSAQYSLDGLREALATLLSRTWNVDLPHQPQPLRVEVEPAT